MKLLPTLVLTGLFALKNGECKAQEVFGNGSRIQALAGTTAGLSGCWSVFGNQAGLAEIDNLVVGGAFQNRFQVSELSSRSGVVVVPVQSSVFAFSLSQFGKIPFRQEKYGLAFARLVGPKLRFGLQFNWYRLYLAEENRSVGSYGAELGAQYLANSRLVVGLHLTNPYRTGVRLSSGMFKYASSVSAGSFYRLSDMFSLSAEVENDFDDHFILKTGLEYAILERVFVRAGVMGKPYRLSGGFGFRLKRTTVDLGSSYNQELGNSPSVSFQYQF